MKSYVGSAEIIVTADEKSPRAFYTNKADSIKGDMDYIMWLFRLWGILRIQGIRI